MSYSQAEVDKFNNLAHEWWNEEGEFKTLHQINPARVKFVADNAKLENSKLIDVGCGGGILSESLAAKGAIVDAIDLAPQSIEIAKLHLYESNLQVNYECIEISEKAATANERYDVLTCMEMLEHVPDPDYIIANCAKLLKSDGIAFFSTLNRNYKSYTLGILAAEYLLKLVPTGTHDYSKFIKPSELRQLLTKNGFEILSMKGINYNPLTQNFNLSDDTSINYLVACRKC